MINTKNENQGRIESATPNEPQIKTITSFDEIEADEKAYFSAPNGQTYLVTYTQNDNAVIAERRSDKSGLRVNKPCESEEFDGSERGVSKVSISNSPIERYQNLSELLNTLPADQDMKKQIARSNNQRVAAENRNVTVDAWLYSFARQSDEDYHLIIGSSDNKENASFLNVEISGLSLGSNPSYPDLVKARQQFKNFVKDTQKCRGGYIGIFENKPVFVRITGSLFFDLFHYTPTYSNLGHHEYKPKTYWEIHPITNIEFP